MYLDYLQSENSTALRKKLDIAKQTSLNGNFDFKPYLWHLECIM
jgi:hypothetical protein